MYVLSKGTSMELVNKKNVKQDQSKKAEKYQCSNIKEITFYQEANNGTTGKYDNEMVGFIPKQYDNSSSLSTQGYHLKLYRQTAESLCN